ncbi:MAG: DUF4956 domain-containing protein [Bacteroidetes bacterium]|nr:DUF4956 domain-containing protein [Bacteroidota bacterium]
MSSKTILTFILFLFLLMPVKVCLPQKTDPTETEISQSDETDPTDKKADKKNKKVVEINERFFISMGIDIAAMILIIFLVYYPNYKKFDYIFTFIIFNLVIFLLTFVLKYVKLSMGAAFGLFAVFSMLRYRTAGISMKDMTYLFIFIAMGLVGAIQLEYQQLGVIYIVILAATFLLDGDFLFKREVCKTILYENIEMIKPENHEALLEDLKKRTGLNIHRIAIGRIDFLKDMARVKIYYYEKNSVL